MKYPVVEQESGAVAEQIVANYTIGTRTDISRAITGDELLNRLRPRVEHLFK